MKQRDADALALAHWGKSFTWGLALLGPFVAAVNFAYVLAAHYFSTRPHRTIFSGDNALAEWATGTFAGTLCGAVLLGVPALVAGLLRVWPMQLLYQRQLNRSATPNTGEFLLGTFLVFEVPVVLAAFIPGSSWFEGPGMRLAFCQLVSLPWLRSSLWVGRKLLGRPRTGLLP